MKVRIISYQIGEFFKFYTIGIIKRSGIINQRKQFLHSIYRPLILLNIFYLIHNQKLKT